MGALDVQIAVRRDIANNVVAELELAKDGEIGLAFVSQLERIELGHDKEGDPITSCVVGEVKGDEATATAKPAKGRKPDEIAKVKSAIVDAYERLADAIETTPDFDGQPVKKVPTDNLRDEVKRRGFLEINETGGLTGKARTLFWRAKTDFLASGRYIENDGFFWKLAESLSDRAQAA